MLSAYSPSIIPHPADWPDSVHVNGYLFLDSQAEWQPSPDLNEFLETGDPPVYIGFGSMAGRNPEQLARLVSEALTRSGQRGLLLTGWGGLRTDFVPDNIFVVDSAPHSWLFPRMAAVVHHGGAGTTAEGLRAGVPTVVVPFVFDQPFWGARVKALGLGPDPIPLKKLTADRLASAIRIAVTDPVIRQRAKSCFSLVGHTRSVMSVTWSPHGRFLASGSEDSRIRLWDAGSAKLLCTLEGHTHWVMSVAWSPKGRFLASGSGDGTIPIWDAGWRELLSTPEAQTVEVTTVGWSPTERFLASGSGDGAIRIWDAGSGKLLRTIKGHKGGVLCVAWSPVGQFLASGSEDTMIHLWGATRGELLQTLEGHVNDVLSAAWSYDGRFLASGSKDSNVRLCDVRNSELPRTIGSTREGHIGSVTSVAWSHDGLFLASGSDDRTIRLWEPESGNLLRILEGHKGGVWSVAWSPDGRFLASGSKDHRICLWDTVNGKMLRILEGHKGGVRSVAWSQDGRFLTSESMDSTIRSLDLGSGTVTAAVNYSSNLPGTRRGFSHTGNFANPITLDVPPTLTITRSGNSMTITWSRGTLLQSDSLGAGAAWSPVPNASAPSYTFTPGAGNKFYRAQVQ